MPAPSQRALTKGLSVCLWSNRRGPLAFLVILLCATNAQGQEGLGPIRPESVQLNEPRPVELDVFMNGSDGHSSATFMLHPKRERLAARRSVLEEIGLKVPARMGPDEFVFLEEVPGLAHRYDSNQQRVYFTAGDELRIPHLYNARAAPEPLPARADYGALLNYSLLASAQRQKGLLDYGFSGGNAAFEGRFFGPFGVLTQTGVVGTTTFSQASAVRLDSYYSYADPKSAVTYRAGDTIAGSLPWTRPIRLGGIQVQRDFTLRPDLVTVPMPRISGSAAVPSTLDILIDGRPAYSQGVGEGPYSIINIPLVSYNGNARVVVRDASGRETESSLPLVSTSNLLAQGMIDYSAEIGFPRHNFGSTSDHYSSMPAFSATLRGGITDSFTGESHVEGNANLFNGGFGFAARIGQMGVLSTASSFSTSTGGTGFQGYASYEAHLAAVTLKLSSQRTFGPYDDLAAVTFNAPSLGQFAGGPGIGGQTLAGFAVGSPKRIDRASLGIPIRFDKSGFGLGFADITQADGSKSQIFSASYTRSLPMDASLFVTAFTGRGSHNNTGLFAGISMPLGQSTSVSSGMTMDKSGETRSGITAQKSQQREDGSYGWRVGLQEGKNAVNQAAASYRMPYGRIAGSVQQSNSGGAGQAQYDGAVAVLGSGVYFGNTVDGSFAVIDAGAPGVPVLQENRAVGRTDAWGKYLVPGLRAYERNTIGIDPKDLPVDMDVPQTEEVVAPALRSGLGLNFAVKAERSSAVVVLTGWDGKLLAAGLKGHVEGGEDFIVGYDGRAYIGGLHETNSIVIDTGGGQCRASFFYARQIGNQVLVTGVVCK